MGTMEFESSSRKIRLSGRARNRLYFQGCERFFGQLAASGRQEAILAQLAEGRFGPRPKDAMLPFISAMEWCFPVGDDPVPLWHVILNTGKCADNPAVLLAAKLEGQCEINCFVEGINRSWMADVVEQGVADRTFHADDGWNDLVSLLREDPESAVVVSYDSYGGPFGDPTTCIEAGVWNPHPLDQEYAWDLLAKADQWDFSIRALRIKSEEWGTEISPESLPRLYGAGVTLEDILETL